MSTTRIRRATVFAPALSLVLAVLSFVAGDVAMVTVASVVKHFVPGTALQWITGVTIVALGAYFIFGLPQIKAWESHAAAAIPENDFRTRWGRRLLERKTWPAFVVASAIGGPLAVGYFAGYTRHPAARRLTLASAWILSVIWTTIYLGVLSQI